MKTAEPINLIVDVKRYWIRLQGKENFSTVSNHLRIIEVVPGRIVCEFEVVKELCNDLGTVHGGLIATYVDIVGNTAVKTMAHQFTNSHVSTDLNVSYVKPAIMGQTVIVRAEGLSADNLSAFASVTFHRKMDQQLVALGRHTMATKIPRSGTDTETSNPPTPANETRLSGYNHFVLSETDLTRSLSKFFEKLSLRGDFSSNLSFLRLLSATPKEIVYEFEVDPSLGNSHKTLHGGAFAFFADMISGTAVRALQQDFASDYFSVDLNVSYLRAVPEGETVIVRGQGLSSGKRLGFGSVEFYRKSDMQIIAAGRHTLSILPPKNSKL